MKIFLKRFVDFKYLLVIAVIIISTLYVKERNKNDNLISENKVLSEKNEVLALNLAPMCYFGKCPIYSSEDTDPDQVPESVVEVPIAMTKGAGEIWIIDEGKVVFKSEGQAKISYSIPDSGMEGVGIGIDVHYVDEFDETGLRPKTWVTEMWRYENGTYVLKDKILRER